MKTVESYRVKIEGIAPLLQHRFAGGDELPPESIMVAGSRDFKEEWESSLYRMEDGTIYQPSDHLENSLVKAAGNFQITGKGKKTYKDLIKSAIVIDPLYIPHLIPKYEIDKRAVRIKTSRVVRQRPIFHKWALEFTLTIIEPQLPSNVVKEIMDYAGRFVGIGDYRPKFGRFHVVLWEKI
jgi:hypothetical protein